MTLGCWRAWMVRGGCTRAKFGERGGPSRSLVVPRMFPLRSPPTSAGADLEEAVLRSASLPRGRISVRSRGSVAHGRERVLCSRGVGQVDGFRDEDTAYATKLSRAGVQVEFFMHPPPT